MPFTLDPQVAAAAGALFGSNPPPKPPVGDISTRRVATEGLIKMLSGNLPPLTEISTQDFHAQASDGHQILCRWYTPPNPAKNGPAVLYAHGGGMIALSVASFDGIIKRYVKDTNVPFLSVDYRLAPEVQAPTPVTDVYAGLEYLHAHASELSIDPNRIAVFGESAGGGIVASLAHYTKFHNGPRICKQILIYPMLDDRTSSADASLEPYLFWSVDDNKTGWGALLGDKVGSPEVPVSHVAGRMTLEEAQGLPPTYMDVGELDLFRDENIEYAQKLVKAGISCEFHLYPGVPHGFEIAPESEVVKRAVSLRYAAIQSI